MLLAVSHQKCTLPHVQCADCHTDVQQFCNMSSSQRPRSKRQWALLCHLILSLRACKPGFSFMNALAVMLCPSCFEQIGCDKSWPPQCLLDCMFRQSIACAGRCNMHFTQQQLQQKVIFVSGWFILAFALLLNHPGGRQGLWAAGQGNILCLNHGLLLACHLLESTPSDGWKV